MAWTPHPPPGSRPAGTIQAKRPAGTPHRHAPPPVAWAGSPLPSATAAQPKPAAPQGGQRPAHAPPPVHWAGSAPTAQPRPAAAARHVPPPPVHWPGSGSGAAMQAKPAGPAAAMRHAAPAPGRPLPAQPGLPMAGVIQASKRKRDEDDDEYIPPHLRKKKKIPRYKYKTGSRENVVRRTGHKKKNFNKKKYSSVYTCRNCGRPIAYYDKSKKFHETKYAYTSKKNKNLHDGTALAMDHYPPWAGRYHQHVKDKSSPEDMRDDFQDESKLRALCKVCNESHLLESGDLPDDYDSDEDGRFDPGTPTHEPENKGRWSDFWDKDPPDGGGTGGGITA